MSKIMKRLGGKDRRSIGKSDKIVSLVVKNEKLFDELFNCLYSYNEVIRMRAADAIQKVVALKPDLIKKYKDEVLKIAKIDQQEVRWHIAQMIQHLGLTTSDTKIAYKFLIKYLKDDSKILKTFSMQALADLTDIEPSLKHKVIKIIESQLKNASPAILSRGNKLIKKLKGK